MSHISDTERLEFLIQQNCIGGHVKPFGSGYIFYYGNSNDTAWGATPTQAIDNAIMKGILDTDSY